MKSNIGGTWLLTGHVETPSILDNAGIASWTLLCVFSDPFLRLGVIRIAMVPLTIVLLTTQAFVPWQLMGEAHFKTALAANTWIKELHFVIELSTRTIGTQTPAEMWIRG